MNAVTKIKPDAAMPIREAMDPLALLREPFPANQISKLPKPLAKREEMDKLPKAKCAECGGYHATSKVLHLDYVGHAALTDRLLDADPHWSWEPCGFGPDGLPAFDRNGGLWIKLTVCGVTRLGYGNAEGKSGGDAVKEIIGDALRNAAMRFGAALDLWHKGDLHAHSEEPAPSAEEMAVNLLRGASVDRGLFREAWEKNREGWKRLLDGPAYARLVKLMQELAAAFPKEEPAPAEASTPADTPADGFGLGDDEIPF